MLRRREAVSTHSWQDEEESEPFPPCYPSFPDLNPYLQVWINQGDIILLSLRDFQDDKADVIVKYTADEARSRTFRFQYASPHEALTLMLHP